MNMDTNRCKLSIVSLFLITCVLVLLTSSISISAQERRIALVIGNSAYKSSPLSNPVNDATDMAAALKKLGFSVKLGINADQKSMEDSIRAFGKELRSGDVGLFYFAGHGLQVHGRNYLIPVDANIESEADVKYESVDVGRVLSQMYEAENGLNIVILDACRDNPYARSFRTNEKGLAKMDAPTGSILAYATAPGSVAADGAGRNGLYTSMLLKHMMEPNLTIERVFKRVRIDVVKSSGKVQIPWESSSLMGDFYFNTKRGIVVENQPVVEQGNPIKEILKPKVIKKNEQYLSSINVGHEKVTQNLNVSPPYSLAIFPFKMVGGISHESDILFGLEDALVNSKLFSPIFSYYRISARVKTQDLDRKHLPPDIVKDLVVKKSFFGNYKPDVDFICKLGKRFDVDFVLFYRFEANVTLTDIPEKIEVFLINIATKKLYSDNVTLLPVNDQWVDSEVKLITGKVFNNLARDNALQ